MRHRPQDAAVRTGIASLFVGAIEGYISADPELLLADAIETVSADFGPEAADRFVADVFRQVPKSYLQDLAERLSQRNFSRGWLRFVEDIESPTTLPGREASDALRAFLAQQHIDPDSFHPNPIHHEAINDAIAHFLEHQDALFTVSRSPRIQLRSIVYPATFPEGFQEKLSEFEQGLREIDARVSDAFGGELVTSETPIADLDSRLALRVKVLLLVSFFFFTEQRRKDSWGVIPVGQHFAFGLVLPDDLYQRLKLPRKFDDLDAASSKPERSDRRGSALEEMSAERSGSLSMGGARWRRDATMSFLTRLIRHLDEVDGRIVYRRGFVMGDLLVEMMRADEKGPELVPLLNELLQEEVAGESNGDESDLSIFPKVKNTHQYREPSASVLDRTCALFDLGQIEVVQGALSHEKARGRYHIVLIKHGLNVPVGLGFSLPLLPALLKREDWTGERRESFLY